MSLPRSFERKVKSGLALHAVWPPGDPVEIGDVMTRQSGIFRPIDNLSSFGIDPELQEFPDQRSLNFQTTGTRTTTFQGGVQIDPSRIDANLSAGVELTFSRDDSYFMRTSEMTGVEIERVRSLAVLADNPEWKSNRYFVAWQIYEAANFTFLGTRKKNKKVGFSGKGSTVLKFLTAGTTAGLTRTSSGNVTVDLTGKRGPIAIALLRIRRNGEVAFV